jgi:hypothetical protein
LKQARKTHYKTKTQIPNAPNKNQKPKTQAKVKNMMRKTKISKHRNQKTNVKT